MSKQKQTFIDRYRMYPWYLNIALILFYIFGSISSPLYTSVLQYKNIKSDPFNGAVYPIEYVPEYLAMKSSLRDKTYLELPSSVFVKTPKYDIDILGRNIDNQKPGDDEYEETLAARVIYPTVYMGSYNLDYKEFEGSHLAIDIKSPVGAPIRNIANGVVVNIGLQPNGFGNFVVIKHNNVPLPNGKIGTIFSCYAHMNEVYVNIGKKINKGSVIGTVGSTGMVTGSHLHFQIDIEGAPFHPYRPFTGKEARDSKVNFFEGINIGLGKDKAIKYTINPLEFVNNNITNILVKKKVKSDVIVASNIEAISAVEKKSDIKDSIVVEKMIVNNNPELALLEDNIELNSAKDEIINDFNIEEKDKINTKSDKSSTKDLSTVKKEIISDIVKEEVKTIKKEKINLFDDELISLDDDLIISDNVELSLLDTNDIVTNSNLNLLDDNKKEIQKEQKNNIVSEEKINEEKINEEKSNDDINIIAEVSKIDSLKNNDINLFTDINIDNKYYKAIKFLKNKGAINGFSDNTFREKSNITRAEALKIFLLSFDKSKDSNANKKFLDVNVKSWENGYILKGIELSLVSSNNNKFYPNRTINRVEGLKMLLKITNVKLDSYSNKDILITDVKKDDWFYKYIVYSIENKLLEIDTQNIVFEPERPLTRGELVNMIYLMIEK